MRNSRRPSKFKDPYFLPDSGTLEALGTVTVAASGVEEMLHTLYWKLAGVGDKQGAILTREMKPNRLADDIIKLAGLAKLNAKQIDDLKDIFAHHKSLSGRRNEYIHWIWIDSNKDRHKIRSPAYRGEEERVVSTEEVNALAADLSWLQSRLDSHCVSQEELLATRKRLGKDCDLYAPAPWLK
jgi:hypothetical protein